MPIHWRDDDPRPAPRWQTAIAWLLLVGGAVLLELGLLIY